jgi:ketosteroid isomerase-like protein
VRAKQTLSLVRQAYDAWNRADWHGVFALFDPEIEVRPPELWPETAPLRGRANVRQAFETVVETSDDLPSMAVAELQEIGHRVLASVRGRRQRSQQRDPIEASFSQVFQLRDAKIVRIDFYLDHAAAREAVGLPRG